MVALQTLWRLRVVSMLLSFLFTLLVTISIQSLDLKHMAVARVKLSDNGTSVDEMRFGVWSFCLHRTNFDNNPCDTFSPCTQEDRHRICSAPQYGYFTQITHETSSSGSETFNITRQWTRSLLVLVFATIATFTTFITLLMPRPSLSLWVARISLLVCFCTLLVGILFVYSIQTGMKKFDSVLDPDVEFGAGLELLIVSFIILILEERARWYIRRREAQSVLLPRVTPHRTDNESDSMSLSPIDSRSTLPAPPPAYKADLPAKDAFGCTICLREDLKDFTALPCRHAFCAECTSKALKRSKRCPLCNEKTRKKDLQSVQIV